MSNRKNFAIGTVATAPSPATTGNSLTLQGGEGALMPAAPFYVTATPRGMIATLSNSEICLVTAISGDVLTITRAQRGTSAKSIAVDWFISNSIYTEDIPSAQSILEIAYPVGSLYMNKTVSTNPSTLFGFGTWTAVTDKFILGVGSTYTANTTGGAATHTLTVDEMPSHNHTPSTLSRFITTNRGLAPAIRTANSTTNGAWAPTLGQSESADVDTNTANSGSGAAHNNMPPYQTAYIWERTA